MFYWRSCSNSYKDVINIFCVDDRQVRQAEQDPGVSAGSPTTGLYNSYKNESHRVTPL